MSKKTVVAKDHLGNEVEVPSETMQSTEELIDKVQNVIDGQEIGVIINALGNVVAMIGLHEKMGEVELAMIISRIIIGVYQTNKASNEDKIH
jgi:hypothetical protein